LTPDAGLDPPLTAVRHIVAEALAEDLTPLGDITASLLPEKRIERAFLVARKRGVVAGTACAAEAFAQVDAGISVDWRLRDGDAVAAMGTIAELEGPLRSIVTAERTALNFLSHLSGVATETRRYVAVAAAANPSTRIADTRKTTPGLRSLEKAAVRAGGGVNHRGNLSEGVLVKDNHLGMLGIEEAVATALRRWPARMVEVECEDRKQVEAALRAGATLVMCDNMTPEEVGACVELVRAHPRGAAGAVLVEASGGIDIGNVGAYAAAGADIVSVGAITHSAPILDIGLDLGV
jgi:nicotinate-nucleotide pyrophosphorylase (carboxylating)